MQLIHYSTGTVPFPAPVLFWFRFSRCFKRSYPGAVLLPVGTIDEETASAVIPEKDDTVLVYCRSGNRSKTASAASAELGYTNIYEFGGINTWPYEIEQ